MSKIHQLFQTDEVLSESYDFHEVTEWTLQFGMEGVEMELMVSPCWGRPGNFYTFLETIKSQHRSRLEHAYNMHAEVHVPATIMGGARINTCVCMHLGSYYNCL